MGNGLERRLRKLEKTQQAKKDSTVIDQEELTSREELRQLRSTPEGRRLVRRRAMESAQQMLSAMQARKRAQIAKMVSPEELERLKKQWAEEDAEDEARRKKLADWMDWMEARGSIPCDCRDCAPVARGTGSETEQLK